MTNPLLKKFKLPPFSAIRPEHIVPAVQSAIYYCRKTVEQVVAQPGPFNWDNLCKPLIDAEVNLDRILSPVVHLNGVKNNDELRKSYEKTMLLISEYSTWVGQHQVLYNAYRNLRDGSNYNKLSIAQKKTIDNTLRDFRLSGINLSGEQQQYYGKIIARLSELGYTYSNNILDATMGWSKLVMDRDELSGLPDSARNTARAMAVAKEQEGWLFTLDLPNYRQVLTYCDNAALRKELYRAYHTIASDQGPNAGKWDNGPIMNEIIVLRHKLAQVLGFNSYADKSLVTKMARYPQKVLNFITYLAKRARPKGEQEWAQLRYFVKENWGYDTIEPWDIAYYSEKQKQHLFAISDEQLRPYFPEPRVISGLFEVVKRLYGITAKERTDVDTWHPEVRFFDLLEEDGELCGSFYLDLYTRDNKLGGAWMDDCRGLMCHDGTWLKPVAYITCNFNRPINGQPALFTHNEVITLFHEFGHCLHHTLTNIDTPGVSGIKGIPWDAIELPSQLMENFCWQQDALSLISGHYETGNPLPTALINKLVQAKNYQIALFLLRQLEFALFDLKIHYEFSTEPQVLGILAEVQQQVAVINTVDWDRFTHSFNHIFAGSYAAGYYSYLWADVLAADAWSRFEEEGIFNREIGKSFREHILSRGGSEDPMVLFSRFLGREPQSDALLRNYGLKTS